MTENKKAKQVVQRFYVKTTNSLNEPPAAAVNAL